MHEITEEMLKRIVGLREGDELEVKSALYGAAQGDKREFASDVAAFANRHGGVLVLGAEEVGDEVQGLIPLAVPAGEVLRLRQIATDLISPHVDVDIATVATSDPDRSYLVIAIPRSPRAPHAVAVNDALRYVVRDGPRKRAIGEAELATLYRRRFDDAQGRADRLADIFVSANSLALDDKYAWLLIALVPETPGELPITSRSLVEFDEWLRSVAPSLPAGTPLHDAFLRHTVGIRRLIAGDSAAIEQQNPKGLYVELHCDGSGLVATPVGIPWSRSAFDATTPNTLTIDDEWLALTTMGVLHLLGKHAQRSGTSSDANLLVGLQAVGESDSGVRWSFGLGMRRGLVPGQLPGTRTVRTFETVGHTFPIDALANAGVELVAAAALVLDDVVSAFGRPNALQVDREGTVFIRYFNQQLQGQVRAWCDAHDVTVSEANNE